jgi:lipid-binding SYLF domain-containing protein
MDGPSGVRAGVLRHRANPLMAAVMRASPGAKRPSARPIVYNAAGLAAGQQHVSCPRENRAKEIPMLQKLFRSTGMAVLLAASAALVVPDVHAQADPQAHIAASEKSLSDFLRDPEMTWLQQNFGRAKAVIIAPEIVKAGFIFGGSGGRALVVARDPKSGKWLGPAFYAMATASVGFQAGISVSEGITLVMTDKGFNSLLATSFKMGGDASVAVGPVGAGAKSNVVADLITFNRAKGVYGGLNFDGTVVTASDDWNASFYCKKVLPPDILVRASVRNKAADKLLAQVTAAAKKK